MTITDDALVRDLAERADLAAPPMSLDPAVVLAAGRRHRHARVGTWAGLGAALAIVTAVVAVGSFDPPDATPPAAATAELAVGLVATAANDADVVGSDGGDALALTDGAGHRYTVRFDVAAGTVLAFEGTVVGAEGDGGWFAGFGAGAEGADEGEGISQASGLVSDVILVAGYVSGPGDVRLEWSGDGPTRALEVPTFAVPGATGRVYIVRIEGAAPDGRWPTVAVVQSGKNEHRADVPLDQLIELAAATGGPVVTVADGGTEVDSSAGPVLDLGVAVLNDFARETVDGREDLTYALRVTTWGEVTGDATLTEAVAGAQTVTLAGRRSFGALTPMRSSAVAAPHDTVAAGGNLDWYGGGPVLSAGFSASDADILGLLPSGETSATLVVERAAGTERTELPTFAVPGLPSDAAFFFFTLHDEAAPVWQAPAHLELVATDGNVTRWALTGEPLD